MTAKVKQKRIPRADRLARAQLAYTLIKEGKLNRDIRRETLAQFGAAINYNDIAKLRKGEITPDAKSKQDPNQELRAKLNQVMRLMRRSRIAFISLDVKTQQIRVEQTVAETWQASTAL